MWGDPSQQYLGWTQTAVDSPPPLPPEQGEAPPLPPEEEPPPLPPPDDLTGPQPSVEGSQREQVSAPWHSYQPQGNGYSRPPPSPQGALGAMPLQGVGGQQLFSHPQTVTPYPWDRHPGYAGYTQGYDSAAYSSYQAGYQDPSGAYVGYNGYVQPPYEHQQSYQGPAPQAWSSQSPAGTDSSWQQPAPLQGGVEQIAATATSNEVDAEDIFLKPGRDTRPRKIAVIMRGLPGSGKSYVAKKLRDIEAEHGGEAPRIHALDDYFVTEVEKEEVEHEAGKRPKKKTVTVMEYLYEPDLEDTYKQSILRAFTKTVEEGRFTFVILDAPNILVEDFRPFYLAAQRTGYQVFVLKPLETDSEVCFKRNVHQRDRDSLSDLAALYEPTPKLYTQLLVESLFDLPKPPKDSGPAIAVIDMEDDASPEDDQPKSKSRWAALEDEEPDADKEQPRKRRRRKDESPQAEAPSAAASKPVASIVRKPGSAPPDKSVRWADEVAPAEGFTIGGAAAQKLAVVHYVEGLGPANDDGEDLHAAHLHTGSFQDQAREDRKSEGQTFRDILFGGRR